VVSDHNRPLKFKGYLRVEGLFQVSTPFISVVGPSVFHGDTLVARQLTRGEFLTIFDVPSILFEDLLQCGYWRDDIPLPFESALSPVFVTSIFRQLWSSTGGVSVISDDSASAGVPFVAKNADADDTTVA
jgi:hypothetical protein